VTILKSINALYIDREWVAASPLGAIINPANECEFGLSGGIYTADADRACEMTLKLRTG
jgi:acyl-CoA reductase-like NAD-dependent aldehyde dehydrogenase